jgi:hypothetical protein
VAAQLAGPTEGSYFWGERITLRKDARPEIGIEDQAAILGDTMLRSLYVAGPEDLDAIEKVTGRRVDTLPPCEECREVLWESPHTEPGMMVTSIAADLSRIETRPLEEIHIAYVDFSAPPPSILEQAA